VNVPAGVVEGMRDYYARRATYYERVYFKPERQADLRDMEAAKAANMRGIIAGYGYTAPPEQMKDWPSHGKIDSPVQLLKYLE